MNVTSQSWKDFGELAYCSLLLSEPKKDQRNHDLTRSASGREEKWRSGQQRAYALKMSSSDEMRVALLSNTAHLRTDDALHNRPAHEPDEAFTQEIQFLRQENAFYLARCEELQKEVNELQCSHIHVESLGDIEVSNSADEPQHLETREQFTRQEFETMNLRLLKEASKVSRLEAELAKANSLVMAKENEISKLEIEVSKLNKEKVQLEESVEHQKDRVQSLLSINSHESSEIEKQLISAINTDLQDLEDTRSRMNKEELNAKAQQIFKENGSSWETSALIIKQIEGLFRSHAFSVIFGIMIPSSATFEDVLERIKGLYDEERMRKALLYCTFDFGEQDVLTVIEWLLFCRESNEVCIQTAVHRM